MPNREMDLTRQDWTEPALLTFSVLFSREKGHENT
jgi:hypothetical protein